MSIDEGLLAWVHEALEPMGLVTMRKMMGGGTLYLDGVTFAILAEDGLWLKADAQSDAAWDAAGCPRFTYHLKDGRTGTMNYRRAPDDVDDDADAMRQWARLALEAGIRAAARKKPRSNARK